MCQGTSPDRTMRVHCDAHDLCGKGVGMALPTGTERSVLATSRPASLTVRQPIWVRRAGVQPPEHSP